MGKKFGKIRIDSSYRLKIYYYNKTTKASADTNAKIFIECPKSKILVIVKSQTEFVQFIQKLLGRVF